jgi:hypothetical protein
MRGVKPRGVEAEQRAAEAKARYASSGVMQLDALASGPVTPKA